MLAKSLIHRTLATGELNEYQLGVLEAAIRAERKTGEIATLSEIAREHGTTIANVRDFLRQLARMEPPYIGTRTRGRHTRYFVLRDTLGHEFDRRFEYKNWREGFTTQARLIAERAAEIGDIQASPAAEAIQVEGIDPIAELRQRHPDARAVQLDMPIKARGLKAGDWIFVEDREPR